MRLIRRNKGTRPVLNNAERASVVLDNKVRNHRLIITVEGRLTVAGAAAGAVRNGGRLSAALAHALNENGEDTFGPIRGKMLRQLSEFDAGQPLGGVTLPSSSSLPIGTYPLSETYEMAFADRRLINPAEAAYMEADPNSFFQLDTWVPDGPQGFANLVAPAMGATVTLSNLTVTVEQVFAPLAGVSTLPIWKARYRELSQIVAGANPQELFYVKTESRLRRLIISQEKTITADGGTVAVDDIINALRLIGDGADVIGPNQSPFAALLESQRQVSGGDVTFEGATFLSDFADDGRLSNTIIPRVQFPNFRYEANVQPSVTLGAGTSRLRVGIIEYTRPVGGQYPVVQPELPDWAIPLGI